MVNDIAFGSVKVDDPVPVHPLASVAVTVYVPEVRLDIVAPEDPLLHK